MQIEALARDVLTELRDRAPSEAHVPVTADGGEPLRCCLRNAEPREQLLLTSYSPPLPDSPYREHGPIFLHADATDCTPLPAGFPPMSSARRQALRAYDERGWIRETELAEPGESAALTTKLLAEPGVSFVEVRSPGHGCYMFRVRR
ncbi:DUF1203 domain-containing protein [Flexivirga meconopsidis]|uniref:DUF1203 domain-containing protein n=1 Tax=Flexivirga meconopsidis TaxID=2977121 RepID=UPI00223F9C9F|nr:DUF1203 domain-containing protein [Flexivirga meconopsidis]